MPASLGVNRIALQILLLLTSFFFIINNVQDRINTSASKNMKSTKKKKLETLPLSKISINTYVYQISRSIHCQRLLIIMMMVNTTSQVVLS